MSNGAEIVADALMDSLLVDETFELPTVNLNDPAFEFPTIVGNPLYNAVSELTNEDLTTRIVGGTGTYDAIMASQAAHLKDEFNAGRITGAEYTKAYIALAQSASGQAIQFLLGKDQAYWASVIAQGQALTAKVQLETAKAQLAIALAEMKNQRATFALNKIRLANEDAQYGITKYNLENMLPAQLAMANAQKLGQDKDNLIADYTLITKLPAETAVTNAQKTGIDKANEIAAYNLITTLPAQTAQITSQTAIAVEQSTKDLLVKSAQITSMVADDAVKAKQVLLVQEQVDSETKRNELDGLLDKEKLHIVAQTSQVTAQTSNVTAEGLNIPKQGTQLDAQTAMTTQQTANLVSEELGIDARTALATQQKTNLVAEALNIPKQGTMLDAQKSGVDKANSIADYNLANLLPAQLTLVKEQGEVQRAQTLDARSDAATVAGSVKSQKDLYAQQVLSYKRSSEINAAKVWTDAWVADSAIQDSPTVPASFTGANISAILTSVKTLNGL